MSDDHPADPWSAYAPAQPRGRQRPRRWIVVIVVVWCVLLAAGVGWAIATGGPTAREQSTVADALPVVDRATVELVRAISDDGQAVAAISGLTKTADCSVTVFRSGERRTRRITAFVAPGTELALLRRVGDRLPAAYRPIIRTGVAPRLNADAGLYVLINATVQSPGVVGFVVDTGDCRVPGQIPASANVDAASVDAFPTQRAQADRALARLRVRAASFQVAQSACPDGGLITTVELVGAKGATLGPLDVALSATSGHIAVSTPDLFAYRVDKVGVSARVVDDAVIVTATTPC
jgi:hypothetical protein